VDGEVVSGESDVDESLVTGEPVPVVLRAGSRTLSGSLNGHGTLLVRVTVVGEESFLRQVILFEWKPHLLLRRISKE
jgi:cation transport ATPase